MCRFGVVTEYIVNFRQIQKTKFFGVINFRSSSSVILTSLYIDSVIQSKTLFINLHMTVSGLGLFTI